MMRAGFLRIACFLLTLFAMTACSHLQRRAQEPDELRIRAFIDGSDTIKILGNELWYQHHDFDLPGKWKGEYDEPTYINGRAWKPRWNDSVSKPYQNLWPPLPEVANEAIQLTKEAGRGEVSITETPSAENDYTLSIYFDDNEPGGAEWYEIVIEW